MGKSTLAAVKADVEQTTFPSHVKPTPKNLGQISHGKLSAKEWISACTISLAITLPRVWSQEGIEPTTQQRYLDMLKNFAALVALVNIASQYSITHQDTLNIEAWTATYVGGLIRLFPAFKIHPYHHIVLHLGEMLRDFGPGFSWAAWAFEYLNGLALQIPNNWKFGGFPTKSFVALRDLITVSGELEDTIFKRMCGSAQLRALLIDGALPDQLLGFRTLFKSTLNYFYPDDPPEEGSQALGEWRYRAEKPTELVSQDPEYDFLRRLGAQGVVPIIQRCSWALSEGIKYRPSTGASEIDSHLEVAIGQNVFAARIDSIFVYVRSGRPHLLGLVSLRKPLEPVDRAKSPYTNLPELGPYLVRSTFLEQKQLVPISSFRCPVAICPFTTQIRELQECTVIVPLRRR